MFPAPFSRTRRTAKTWQKIEKVRFTILVHPETGSRQNRPGNRLYSPKPQRIMKAQPNSTPYHHRLALVWIANAMKRIDRRSNEAQALIKWIRENAFDLCVGLNGKGGATDAASLVKATTDIPVSKITRRGRRKFRRMVSDHDLMDELLDDFMDSDYEGNATGSDKAWRRLRKHIEKLCKDAKGIGPDRTAVRLQELAGIAHLAPEDVCILEFVLLYQTHPLLESLVDDFLLHRHCRTLSAKNNSMPCFLGMSANAVRRRLADDAPLVASGLLAVDSDGDIDMASRLEKLAWESEEESDVRRLLLSASKPTELDWSDFDHVAEDRDYLAKILEGALRQGAKGVNILLYGPNGTGKTELSKVLANRLGVTLFGVGEKDERGGEPSRGERLADLRLAGCLLGKDPNALLLFDEMDDLFSGGAMMSFLLGFMSDRGSRGMRSSRSKLFMNRLLEENAAPTIWTTNHAESTDPAFLRRMTYVVHLRKPPTRVRERILTRQLGKSDVCIEPEYVEKLASRFEMPPGVVDGPIRAAALLPEGDRHALLERGFGNIAALMRCERPSQAPPARFDPALIRADQDLVDLAERLTGQDAKPFSICLQGPPGTGKSAYARYLAERMGMEVLHKRTSDLLSMWVGASEQNIAEAFREARDTRSFLIFDEADSLLADRRRAHRSWEVTQVNEMLTQMEMHPLPFACTTNFVEKLDDATLRRFLFKVTLRYSSPEQAAGLFRAYFDMEAPEVLSNLKAFTPGDFPVVRRKAEVTGQLDDADALVAMLKAECDAKPNRPSGMGFRAA